jgi:hypothetical protein
MAATSSEANAPGVDATLRSAVPRWREWVCQGRSAWLIASWLGLLLLLGLVAMFGTDTGISFDEAVQRTYGDLVLAWFSSGFRDSRAVTFANLYFYGGLFDALAQLIAAHLPFDEFDTRHVLTALCAVLGIVAAWNMAARIGGPRAGFFAGLVLALTPAWVGHGLFNPKDIPFGAAAAFVGVAALRIASGPAPIRVRDMCLAGLAAGTALAVRPGGVFLLSSPCLAAGLRLGLEAWRRWRSRKPLMPVRLLGNLALCVAVTVCIAWPLMLSAWRWAQLRPFRRPLEAMAEARHFLFNAPMLWQGKTIRPQSVPLSYLPVWFKVTLPELYLAALAAGATLLAHITRSRSWVGERVVAVLTLASLIALPLAAVFVTRPALYDAQRHFLFILPPLAALAGCALSEVLVAPWLPRLVRAGIAGLIAALALLVVKDMIALHPYEYTYFNRSSGGLRKQFRRFETDYWGLSYKEGLQWIVNELPPVDPRRKTRVASCDFSGNARLNHYRAEWPGAADKIEIVSTYAEADLFLAVRRWNCHRVPGKIIHVVFRQEAPLLYVRRTVH